MYLFVKHFLFILLLNVNFSAYHCESSFLIEYLNRGVCVLNNSSENFYVRENFPENGVDLREVWESFPKDFLPDSSGNPSCRDEVSRLREGYRRKELWAMKVLDSNAKIPSGILSGNLNQYGDFDECLSAGGKYCLATFNIPFEETDQIDRLVYSHYFTRSNVTDVAHRVPKSSSISWGVCLPSKCTSQDLRNEMRESLKHFRPDLVVNESDCFAKDDLDRPYSIGTIITMLFISMVVIFVICGTYIDTKNYEKSDESLVNIMTCFSLKKNIGYLFSDKEVQKIPSLDGLRVLSALPLLKSHHSIAMFFSPFTNKTRMADMFNLPWSVMGRTVIIYTDSFFVLSALLSSRSFLEELEKNDRVNFWVKLKSRLVRILPNFIFLIMFCTYVLPHMGSGPLWGVAVEEHSKQCKNSMWWNFIFLHNYLGFEKMCLTHTHHLSIDMQLFFFAPLATLVLWRMKGKGVILLLAIAAYSTYLRYTVTVDKQLSVVVYNSMPVWKYFATGNNSYIITSHRLTIYIIGIMLAYVLHQKWSRMNITKLQAWIGWLFFTSVALYCALGPWHMAVPAYVYEPIEAAYYTAFLPIGWGLFCSWIIFADHNDSAGWFGQLLSWRGFRYLSRISYGIYLTQFPIFFYEIGTMRHSDYFTILKWLSIPKYTFVLVVSTVLFLCIEKPFINLYKYYTDKDAIDEKPFAVSDLNNNAAKSENKIE